MNDNELKARLEDTLSLRACLKHKLRLVKAYKENSHIVAMTGTE